MTTHGGQVLTGSGRMRINGKGVVRKGDRVSCPRDGHEDCTVIEGDEGLTDQGVPIALHGHRCSCGCTLIASGHHVGRS